MLPKLRIWGIIFFLQGMRDRIVVARL